MDGCQAGGARGRRFVARTIGTDGGGWRPTSPTISRTSREGKGWSIRSSKLHRVRAPMTQSWAHTTTSLLASDSNVTIQTLLLLLYTCIPSMSMMIDYGIYFRYQFDNSMNGCYIAPAFMDKLLVHIAKNFINLPNIKVCCCSRAKNNTPGLCFIIVGS